MERKCPMCRLFILKRPEVQTCGSPECRTNWRESNLKQRAFAIEHASLSDDAFMQALKALAQQRQGQAPDPTEPSEEADVSASEFTKRILGE